MDIKAIVQNQEMKDICAKAGIPQEQAQLIANEALQSIIGHFEANPAQMSSLISEQPKSEADYRMRAEIEQNFVQNLIKKVGLPEATAQQVKGAMPNILNQFSGSLSAEAASHPQGIAGAIENIQDLFKSEKDIRASKQAGSNPLDHFLE